MHNHKRNVNFFGFKCITGQFKKIHPILFNYQIIKKSIQGAIRERILKQKRKLDGLLHIKKSNNFKIPTSNSQF